MTLSEKEEEAIMKEIRTDKAPAAIGPYSQAIVVYKREFREQSRVLI